MSLEISFSCVFSNSWPRGLGISDFCLLANGFDQNHDKIVYLIKNVRQQPFEYLGATSRV